MRDLFDIKEEEQPWELYLACDSIGAGSRSLFTFIAGDKSYIVNVKGSGDNTISLKFSLRPIIRSTEICNNPSVSLDVFSLFVKTDATDSDDLQFAVDVVNSATDDNVAPCYNYRPTILFYLGDAKHERGFCLIEDFISLSLYGVNKETVRSVVEDYILRFSTFITVEPLSSCNAITKKYSPGTAPKDFGKMFAAQNNFSDVKLKSKDGELLPAHKFVLAARSSFFRRILEDESREDNGIILVTAIEGKPLAQLLRWIYTDEIECLRSEDGGENLEMTLRELLKGAGVLGLRDFAFHADHVLLNHFRDTDDLFNLATLAKQYGLEKSCRAIRKAFKKEGDICIKK